LAYIQYEFDVFGVQIGTSTDQYSLGINEIVREDSERFRDLIDYIFSDMANLLEKNLHSMFIFSNLLAYIQSSFFLIFRRTFNLHFF
jgi:hypothetical protein